MPEARVIRALRKELARLDRQIEELTGERKKLARAIALLGGTARRRRRTRGPERPKRMARARRVAVRRRPGRPRGPRVPAGPAQEERTKGQARA